MNASGLLRDACTTHAERPAFVAVDEEGRTEHVVTFGRFDQLVDATARGLRARRVARGSSFVVCLPTCLERFVVMAALLRIGAVPVLVEPRDRRTRLEPAADETEAVGIVAPTTVLLTRFAHPGLRRLPVAISVGRRRAPGTTRFADLLALPFGGPLDLVDVRPDDAAMVRYVGPRDARARGLVTTHRAMAAKHGTLAATLAIEPGMRVWTDWPDLVLHALVRGASTILPPTGYADEAPSSPKQFHRHLVRCAPDALALAPVALAGLVRAPGRIPITSVRELVTGGAPVTPRLLDGARALAPDARIVTLYGHAGVLPIASATAGEVDERRAAMRSAGGAYVGTPTTGTDVKVVRHATGRIEVTPGTRLDDWCLVAGAPGELLVAGDHVDLPDDPGATDVVVDEDGRRWLRTGDVVRRETDGDRGLWVLGRQGGGWKMGGQRRWPLEVEMPIMDLPEVARAAICMPRFTGSDREFKNASAVLAVQPADGFDRADARDAAVRVLRERGLAATIEVRSLRRIPLDPSAGMRVDIAALQDKLKPENDDDY